MMASTMLALYRRHLGACSHRTKGRTWKRCQCPVWVDGAIAGQRIHRSLDTRDWNYAGGIVREWEYAQRVIEPGRGDCPIKLACSKFLADVEARHLSLAAVKKYRVLLVNDQRDGSGKVNEAHRKSPSLCVWADERGLVSVSQLSLEKLQDFRAAWQDGGIAAGKKLERLRAFGRFLVDHGWWAENVAKKLRSPRHDEPPTMPFTRDQMHALIAGCDDTIEGRRLRALILLLRYSGLRIGDAASLAVDRLDGHRLFLYTHKTKVPVYTVLPEFVVRELAACPRISERYWWWTGGGTKETLSGNWRRAFRRLCAATGVKGGHPHQFRDTFAVELLLAGVAIEQVSVLLGHASVKITEKHYAPWVQARQAQAEAAIARALVADPLALMMSAAPERAQ